jgi:hypothetical protein
MEHTAFVAKKARGKKGPHIAARIQCVKFLRAIPIPARLSQRQRKNIARRHASTKVESVCRVKEEDVGPVRFYDVDAEDKPALDGTEVKLDISTLRRIEASHKTEHVVVLGRDGSDGEPQFICAKLSSRECAEINTGKWEKMLNTFSTVLKKKPCAKRGKTKVADYKHYVCAGFRKDPLGKDVSKYAYKPTVNPETCDALDDELAWCSEQLEAISRRAFARKDLKSFRALQSKFGLPRVGDDVHGVATQFAIGLNYSSLNHTDDDFFYTTLAVARKSGPPPTTETERLLLQFFCFPDYGIAIPLREGDILVFNPLVGHGCSNPRTADSLIFSCYVSSKTVCTRASVKKDGVL